MLKLPLILVTESDSQITDHFGRGTDCDYVKSWYDYHRALYYR